MKGLLIALTLLLPVAAAAQATVQPVRRDRILSRDLLTIERTIRSGDTAYVLSYDDRQYRAASSVGIVIFQSKQDLTDFADALQALSANEAPEADIALKNELKLHKDEVNGSPRIFITNKRKEWTAIKAKNAGKLRAGIYEGLGL